MGVRTWLDSWPAYRQLTGSDPLGRGAATQSPHSKALAPRTQAADRVAHSVCPYCAVGCAQRVYVCLLYTSPSPRDLSTSRMPSSA